MHAKLLFPNFFQTFNATAKAVSFCLTKISSLCINHSPKIVIISGKFNKTEFPCNGLTTYAKYAMAMFVDRTAVLLLSLVMWNRFYSNNFSVESFVFYDNSLVNNENLLNHFSILSKNSVNLDIH